MYLVPTIDDKGHKVRVMVCSHRHIENPSFQERMTGIVVLSDYMQILMGNETWFIVSGEFATHPHHWHVIACDNHGTPDEIKQLHKTPRVMFPLGI